MVIAGKVIMKKTAIAIVLSIVMVAGNIGAIPVFAAEAITQEVIAEETETQDTEEDDTETELIEEVTSSEEVPEDESEEEQKEEELNEGELNEGDQSIQDNTKYAVENEDNEWVSESDQQSEDENTAELVVEQEKPEEVVEKSTLELRDQETITNGNLIATGNCGKDGNNLTWTVYDDGVLEISGSGEMADYSQYSTPWKHLRNQISEIIVCDGVTRIGDYAFYELESCTKLTAAESLTSVGNGAFTYCHINSVYFDGSLYQWVNKRAFTLYYVYQLYVNDNQEYSLVTDLSGLEGISSIPERAFCKCYSLTSAIIPDGVTSIGANAFCGCRWITEIELPDGLLDIGNSAFADSDGFQSIELPDTLTSIGGSAFSGCKKLQSISIPESCT